MNNFYNDNPNLKFYLSHPLMKKIIDLKENNYEDKDTYDYAPLDFEDALDTYNRTLEIIGEICANTIASNAESVDAEGPRLENNRVIYARGTQENHDALTKAGVIGISLPRKYNGLNFPMIPYIMTAELIARADAGFSNIWGLQDCAETLNEFASEDIKNEFLPRFNKGDTASMGLTEPDAGSDLQAVQLKAHYDEEKKTWLLNGVKRFITNGDSNISLVLARSEEGTKDGRGLSLFVFDKDEKSLIVRRIENKLGIKGSPTCELVFKDAPVKLIGQRRLGLIKYVMSLMNGARLGIGAQSVGISEAAYREALKYAKERTQFGTPIIQFPAMYEMLTLMETKLYASRSLLYETTRFVDIYKVYNHIATKRELTPEEKKEAKNYTRLSNMYTPLIKLFGSEYCNQICYDALQIHGGSGFMKDYPIERLYRDARITSIYEGTSELQVVAAIRGVTTHLYLNQIKEYENTELTPETQSLKIKLSEMTQEYEKAVNYVSKVENKEFTSFHARRLVEMAGHIIMGYLLLLDTQREERFKKVATIFVKYGKAQNTLFYELISTSTIDDLDHFRK